MSWEDIEKRMDERFEKEMELKHKIMQNDVERNRLRMEKYARWLSDEDIENSYFVSEVDEPFLNQSRNEFHNFKKKLRKIIYNLFNI